MKTKYEKLPKRFKTKWLKALRSGEYKQGHYFLVSTPAYEEEKKKYCCLGVACHILGALKKNPTRRYSYIPARMMKSYKVPKHLIGFNALTSKLTTLNDSRRYSFKRIANWIEKNL